MTKNISENRVDYLFVSNSLSGGGAERAINIAVNEMAKKKSPVGLLVINNGPQDLYAPNVPTFQLNREWQGGFFSVLFAFLKFYFLIIRIRPRVLILNCDLPELLGAFLFGPWRIVVVEHVPKPWSDRLLLGRIVRKCLSLRKASWVVVSRHLSPWLSDNSQAAHIPNAISDKDTSNLMFLPCGDVVKRLVFIGRLTKNQKQPQWMLDIAEFSRLPVVFFGDGLFRKQLEYDSQAKKINADFRGFVSNPWDNLMDGDLLIVPSAWEGDGLVVVEAISRGIPILLNSIQDLIRFGLPNKNYCKNPKDFAARIEQNRFNLTDLIADKDFALKLTADRNPKVVASKWIEFLTHISD